MRHILVAFFIISTGLTLESQDFKPDPSFTLWYTASANEWEEALPVGNGRLGAMVYGRTGEEIIQINEDTFWSGGPYSTVVKGGSKMLPRIQELIFNGNPIDAHRLFGRYMMGYPVEQQKYQSAANLWLSFEEDPEITGYRRWLDLETGVTHVEYQSGDTRYHREIFSSSPDQSIVIRIYTDKPGMVNLRAQLRGCRNQAHSNYATDYFRMDGIGTDGLMVNGKSADYMGIEGSLRYRVQLRADADGGETFVDGIDLFVKDADAVTLVIVAATNFVNYRNVSGDQVSRVEEYLGKTKGKVYGSIKEDAIDDYRVLFDRVRLELPSTANSLLPTVERMSGFETNDDPALAALCYNFGRYVLISSSRPGTQPANLQGIWNEDMNPSWDSKYTTNINTEMNYWAVESANLAECAEPLIKMVKELADQGSQVAREHYGAKGWVFHQNTDLWRVAAPMDGPTWGTFTTGGAWLTTQLFEHYLYSQNKEYLWEIYPVIRGSIEFFMDFLVEEPGGRWLVTNPSTSPENPPAGEGYEYFFDEITGTYYFTTICYGSSIDMQILYDLFGYFVKSSEILGVDDELRTKVNSARKRLVPPRAGSDGSLMEWTEDYRQMEEKHRHFSHLYGLYPGNVISARNTPDLVEACKAVLEQRGDGGTGFSRAWKMALWARLNDGNRANTIFRGYIKEQAYPQLFAKCYTPLQVDGTLGVTAAITEMLVQSHEGVIELLPAVPGEWNKGRFNGVRVRGGFELDFSWEEGKITALTVLSRAGEKARINTGTDCSVYSGNRKVKTKRYGDGSFEFETDNNGLYIIDFK